MSQAGRATKFRHPVFGRSAAGQASHGTRDNFANRRLGRDHGAASAKAGRLPKPPEWAPDRYPAWPVAGPWTPAGNRV